MRPVMIEFTQDTFGEDGDVKRAKGTRVRVDAMSAKSFVEVKKVAKLVGQPAERATAKAAVKAVDTPSTPDAKGDDKSD